MFISLLLAPCTCHTGSRRSHCEFRITRYHKQLGSPSQIPKSPSALCCIRTPRASQQDDLAVAQSVGGCAWFMFCSNASWPKRIPIPFLLNLQAYAAALSLFILLSFIPIRHSAAFQIPSMETSRFQRGPPSPPSRLCGAPPHSISFTPRPRLAACFRLRPALPFEHSSGTASFHTRLLPSSAQLSPPKIVRTSWRKNNQSSWTDDFTSSVGNN